MSIYIYEWADGSVSLTDARSRDEALEAFHRLGYVQAEHMRPVPASAVTGCGLLLHFEPQDDGRWVLSRDPADRGITRADGSVVRGLDADVILTKGRSRRRA